ncbi:MAG TPA: hypothetical protein VFJ14_04040 [Nocardioidaceae bacterium]|nr:hypothetical protein [Nocardioidaceae bacterium]
MPSPAEPPITWTSVVRTATVTLAVFAVAGVVGGWVWAMVTDPPSYRVQTALPDPLPADAIVTANFESDASFLLVAVVGGLVCAVACTALFRARGLVLLASVLAGSFLASYLAQLTGTALGPASLTEQATGASVGDVLTYPIEVNATAVLLVWPIAAMVGLMLTVSLLTPVPHSAAADPGMH